MDTRDIHVEACRGFPSRVWKFFSSFFWFLVFAHFQIDLMFVWCLEVWCGICSSARFVLSPSKFSALIYEKAHMKPHMLTLQYHCTIAICGMCSDKMDEFSLNSLCKMDTTSTTLLSYRVYNFYFSVAKVGCVYIVKVPVSWSMSLSAVAILRPEWMGIDDVQYLKTVFWRVIICMGGFLFSL